MTLESLISSDLFLPIALALLGLLALVNLALMIVLARNFRKLGEEQDIWRRRVARQIAHNDPMRAAIAAVMAVRREKMTFEQLEREIATLMQSWDQIETLADDAHKRLSALVEHAERAGGEDSAAPPPQKS